MAISFPRKLLREQNHDWNIVGNTAGVGQTSSAAVDVRSDGGGLWVASLNNIRFMDASDALLWRAVRQACNGGVTPIVVPRNDIAFVPWPAGSIDGTDYLPHSDTSLFDDGAGYHQPSIDVTVAAPAALRATALVMDLNLCGALQGGEAFSIEHPTMGWRLYEIATVEMLTATQAEVTFNPPLREAVAADDYLEFDRPRCLMKLQNAAAMDLNVTTWPFSLASVKFIEAKYGT